MSKEKSGTLLLHPLLHINARTCSGGFSEQSESVSVGVEVEGSGRVIKACTAASFLSGWQPDSNSEGKV